MGGDGAMLCRVLVSFSLIKEPTQNSKLAHNTETQTEDEATEAAASDLLNRIGGPPQATAGG